MFKLLMDMHTNGVYMALTEVILNQVLVRMKIKARVIYFKFVSDKLLENGNILNKVKHKNMYLKRWSKS